MPRKKIEIWTDGACIGNPGPGGYGVVLLDGSTRRELSGGYRSTTNNRMELMGPIMALRALSEASTGVLHTDSLYVVKGIEKGWAKGWRDRNWMRSRTEKALNADLWALLLELHEAHALRFQWVKGHAGQRENERCDELANAAARGSELVLDHGYEALSRSTGSAGSLFET